MAFEPLTGTKLQIAEAALETLMARGVVGASAREIARTGNFNQALVFYHFGSVKNLLLAVLDLIGARRVDAYGPDFEAAKTVSELAALAKRIHADDLEQGYITVLGEMVAAGVSDAELGPAVVERMQPWIDMVERKITELSGGSTLAAIVPARDLAYGLVGFYLGIDLLGHLEGDQRRTESLLDLCVQLSAPADALLAAQRRKESS